MGWVKIAYRVTVGNPELKQKAADKTKALLLGVQAVAAARSHHQNHETQLLTPPDPAVHLGTLALAPEFRPDLDVSTESLPRAA